MKFHKSLRKRNQPSLFVLYQIKYWIMVCPQDIATAAATLWILVHYLISLLLLLCITLWPFQYLVIDKFLNENPFTKSKIKMVMRKVIIISFFYNLFRSEEQDNFALYEKICLCTNKDFYIFVLVKIHIQVSLYHCIIFCSLKFKYEFEYKYIFQ